MVRTGKRKGKNLAKMSEEQRARYLQRRADAEEEARRRKSQLLALFMKNKLQRELALSRHNDAKITQHWIVKLRKLKREEQNREIVRLQKFWKDIIEQKDQFIGRLLNDFDEEDDFHATLENANTEIVRKLSELYQQRFETFRKLHEDETRAELTDSEQNMKEFTQLMDQTQEQLECVAYQLEDYREKQLKENHERYLEQMDDLKATTQLQLEENTKTYEAKLEGLWQEYQNILNDYAKRTEEFYSDYVYLKERDDEYAAMKLANRREMDRLSEQIESLKAKYDEISTKGEAKIKEMTKIRDELSEELAKRKQEVDDERREAEELIRIASVESYKVLKTLKELEKTGESLLKMADICGKYEEKWGKNVEWELTAVKRKTFARTEREMKEPPVEVKEEVPPGVWEKMENFWMRVNNVEVDALCLQQERAALQEQNESLREQIKDTLADLNIANGRNAHVNDYLAKRPASMQLDRVQRLQLVENRKCRSASVGPRPSTTSRTVVTPTITEASFTNAVRSKRLTQRTSRLPRITTIVRW